MMQITETMVKRIKEALPLLDAEHLSVEIPEMGGYFVTPAGTPIPESAKRFVEIGIDGDRYLIYVTLESNES